MRRALAVATFTMGLAAQAQSPARVAFEVASIKPHPNAERQDFRYPQWLPGGRFQATVQLMLLVEAAYNLPINLNQRVSVGPEVMRELQVIYDVDATGTFPPGLAGNARADRQRLMLQTLLADRFKLAIHREMKELPVYALLVAKGGPKLQKADIPEKDCPDSSFGQFVASSAADCHAFMGGQGRGLHARAAGMSDLVRFVENWTQRPLIDKTGIKGLYKFDTSGWTPLQALPPPPEGAKAEDGRDFADVPTLFQVFARLGLRMESQKAPVEVFIIDHVEKPSEN